MIQHVVLVNFRHGVPESMRHECVMRLRELAGLVPDMKNWRVGLNMTTVLRCVGHVGDWGVRDAR
jgi:hypothetical protein